MAIELAWLLAIATAQQQGSELSIICFAISARRYTRGAGRGVIRRSKTTPGAGSEGALRRPW